MREVMLLVGALIGLAATGLASDFRAMFTKHWQVAREFTLAVAEAMPEGDYGFRPTPEQPTFGRLMTHIAAQNSSSCASAAGTTPLPEPSVADKETAIRFLAETFNKCVKDLDAMSSGQFDRDVYTFQGEPVLAREALWYTFTHMAHHRGQAEIYLRLKNIKPPAWRF